MSLASTDKTDEGKIGDDLLRGAKAIGQELGMPERKVYYLHSQGYLPFVKDWAGS